MAESERKKELSRATCDRALAETLVGLKDILGDPRDVIVLPTSALA
jgi:hypothetical protein